MWKTFIGDFNLNTETGNTSLRSQYSLTLSTTKRGTDLGTLVVPFDFHFPPVTYITSLSFQIEVLTEELRTDKSVQVNNF